MPKYIFKRVMKQTETYITILLIVLCVIIEFVSNGLMFQPTTIVDICRSLVIQTMFAMCSLMVIISGGFDLSFPAIATFSFAMSTQILVNINWQGSALLGFLLAGIFGTLLGMINGWIISEFKLNTMIVTLSTQSIFFGLTQGVFALKDISSTLPKGLKAIYDWILFSVYGQDGLRSFMPGAFLLMILLIAGVSFLLKKTMFGRSLYAIGGSEVSAERAGINVKKTKFILYSVVGCLAGLIGMLRVCMLRQSIPKSLIGSEMGVLTAVILGGASIYGGTGSVYGTVVAVIIITVVSNSLILLGIDSYWQTFFRGVIILLAVLISAIQAIVRNRRGGNQV